MFPKVTPKNERLEPGNDGESKFGISFSKGPPHFQVNHVLFFGVYLKWRELPNHLNFSAIFGVGKLPVSISRRLIQLI